MLNDMGCETVFPGVVGVACTYTAGDGVRDVHGDDLGRHLETVKKGGIREKEMTDRQNIHTCRRQASFS